MLCLACVVLLGLFAGAENEDGVSGKEAANSAEQLRPSREEQRGIEEVQRKRDTAAGSKKQKQPHGQL